MARDRAVRRLVFKVPIRGDEHTRHHGKTAESASPYSCEAPPEAKFTPLNINVE